MATAAPPLQSDKPDFAPGQIAPAEGTPQQNAPPDLGPNFENLEKAKPRIVSILRELVLSYRTEGIVARRHEIRRIRQAHLYWAGIQYGYFSGTDWQWHLPFGTSIGLGLGVEDPNDAETPRYQFVTNIYQAFGLCFISLMTVSIPTPTFYPQSAQNEVDITTAKAADDARRLIEKNNRPKMLLKKIAWLMWCDGKVGGYVRYIADGQRFGWEDTQDIAAAPAELTPAAFICPTCGTENPAEPPSSGDTVSGSQDADLNAGSFGIGSGLFCKNCSTELGDEDLQDAQSVNIPKAGPPRKTPKGQEIISIIPGLQFHTPPWADERHEMPYLQWNLEVHIAKLKATYKVAAPRIVSSGPISADDTFARASRISVQQGLPATHPGDNLANLVTFSRTWIRPWCFWLIEEEKDRNELLELFPDGCFVAFAGETYCESRNEPMDDSWRILQAMPGDGQNRPSVGDAMIQVNEQYNTISNAEQETIEFGIPPILADSEAIDFDALEGTTAEPASWYPIALRANEKISDKVLQLEPSVLSEQAIQRRQELMGPIGQFLTGITPTVFGSNIEGNDTARAYELAREMAMGRISLFWYELKNFYAELMLLGIDCMRKNRPTDAELPTSQEGGNFEAKLIRLADLKGNIEVYDDPDETYPELPSQVRATLKELLSDEVIGQLLMGEPANLGTAKGIFGLRDFVMPGEDSRIKQLREIQEMRDGSAIEQPPVMGPMGEVQQGPPQSTVPVDPISDDHAVESKECRRWLNSDEGQTAKRSEPDWFFNVQAHMQEHEAEKAKQQGQPNNKPPSESINYKDLTPTGKTQMAAQAGIQEDATEIAGKEMQDKAAKAAQMAAKFGKTAPAQGVAA